MANKFTEKMPFKVLMNVLKGLGIFLVTIVVLFVSCLMVLLYGPAKETRDLFVVSVMETTSAKFLATWFLGQQKVDEIIANNTLKGVDDKTDSELISIPESDGSEEGTESGLELVEIKGQTYKGKMIIVKDPSRVSVGTIPEFGSNKGMTLPEIVELHGAIAGINGGYFLDLGKKYDGGIPLGCVIKDGKLIYGGMDEKQTIIGISFDNILTLGEWTPREALANNVRDAIHFGPLLIVNGVAAESLGTGGGLNPRTAIGQRADGAMLLLVLDGRQASSIGASYTDIIDVMQQYGAVNAANLDGGSSTVMVYKGEIINSCASLYGPRDNPTAIIVK